jgi:hypothetical protein
MAEVEPQGKVGATHQDHRVMQLSFQVLTWLYHPITETARQTSVLAQDYNSYRFLFQGHNTSSESLEIYLCMWVLR